MTTTGPTRLAVRSVSYDAVGATRPEVDHWTGHAGYRSYERTVRLGQGQRCWDAAVTAALAWGVKTRSGFTVEPALPAGACVQADERYWLLARVGLLTVREPVLIVAVVDESNRRGFAYGTLDGHPVSGEEAFIVHRAPDGAVSLTLRSLTRPGRGWWRPVFPAALVAQRWYRRQYLRALVEPPTLAR